ncbi:DUF6542 domain-containing protein [Streptomyces sp. NPDC001262]|uniref:DUF6542 domain-containing protein n=1 Tax=Streptomyces TaxID=1883 RepID=UPI0036A5BD72
MLVALVLPVAGAFADELVTSSLGWIFTLTAAAGAVLAAWTCSRAGAWWVAYAPPPVVLLVTVIAELTAGPKDSQAKGATTGAVHWAIDAFPAMAAAEAALLLVLAVRWMRVRRSVTPGRGARKSGAYRAR